MLRHHAFARWVSLAEAFQQFFPVWKVGEGVGVNYASANGVDSNSPLAQLLGQAAHQGLQGSL